MPTAARESALGFGKGAEELTVLLADAQRSKSLLAAASAKSRCAELDAVV